MGILFQILAPSLKKNFSYVLFSNVKERDCQPLRTLYNGGVFDDDRSDAVVTSGACRVNYTNFIG